VAGPPGSAAIRIIVLTRITFLPLHYQS